MLPSHHPREVPRGHWTHFQVDPVLGQDITEHMEGSVSSRQILWARVVFQGCGTSADAELESDVHREVWVSPVYPDPRRVWGHGGRPSLMPAALVQSTLKAVPVVTEGLWAWALRSRGLYRMVHSGSVGFSFHMSRGCPSFPGFMPPLSSPHPLLASVSCVCHLPWLQNPWFPLRGGGVEQPCHLPDREDSYLEPIRDAALPPSTLLPVGEQFPGDWALHFYPLTPTAAGTTLLEMEVKTSEVGLAVGCVSPSPVSVSVESHCPMGVLSSSTLTSPAISHQL